MEKIIGMIKGVAATLIPGLKKEDSKHGIKETKEALIGVNEVSLFMAEKLKDGAQFSDATDFYAKITGDEAFKAKVMAAYEGYEKIPAEMEDIDAGEGLELVVVQADYVPKFVEAFKK